MIQNTPDGSGPESQWQKLDERCQLATYRWIPMVGHDFRWASKWLAMMMIHKKMPWHIGYVPTWPGPAQFRVRVIHNEIIARLAF